MNERAVSIVYSTWRPMFWEPVRDTGERIMVGVIGEYGGKWFARRTIDSDLMFEMYGKKSSAAINLIDKTLDVFKDLSIKHGLSNLSIPMMGIIPGEIRRTSAMSIVDVYRQASLLYSSLVDMESLERDSNLPAEVIDRKQENFSRHFSATVKSIVSATRPDVAKFVNKHAKVSEDGNPVRFGFCSPKTVAHFAFVNKINQRHSLKSTRFKMWEILSAKAVGKLEQAALITVRPTLEDAMLGSAQISKIKETSNEIYREAKNFSINVHMAKDSLESANILIDMFDA